jgi:hypothetical protein
LLETRVDEVRDVIARVAVHPRRLADDQRMLVGESDSYASAIGRPDRDDRIVAVAITPAAAEPTSPFVAGRRKIRNERDSG